MKLNNSTTLKAMIGVVEMVAICLP